MNGSSTPPEQAEEGRAFLQHRVGRFGLFGAGLGWFFLAYRAIDIIVFGRYEELVSGDVGLHFLGGFSLFAIWLGCRDGTHSLRHIRTVEAIGLVSASAAYAGMGMFIPLAARPDFIVLLAVANGLVSRAIYVPSSALRSVLVSIAAAVPPLVMTYLKVSSIDPEKWQGIMPDVMEMSSAEMALSATVFNAAWWACAVIMCGAASRVIYGLRREVSRVRRLGQYTLEEKLGEGGMGIVYRARHAMLQRPTAVKLLPLEKVGERSLARFEREVQLTARLTHPNTVTVFDYGRTPEGVFYYAMELLRGANLGQVVAHDGPQPAARVAHLLVQVAGALAEAHGIGLIHRDIKPGNIMLVEQGSVPDVAKVLDFGLVKDLEQSDGASLTHAETLTGTPLYMSPETITAPDAVDGRSDLYALGAVGYYLLTGEHVFDGQTVVEICGHHLHSPPVPPSKRLERPVPPDLERLLLACLAKAPDDRPRGATELADRLRACRDLGSWTDADARDWWESRGAELACAAVAGATTASLKGPESEEP